MYTCIQGVPAPSNECLILIKKCRHRTSNRPVHLFTTPFCFTPGGTVINLLLSTLHL